MAATEAQIRAWLGDPASGPDVFGRPWKNKCQALVYQVCARFGTAPTVYSTATNARLASDIVSTDAAASEPGSVHYWDYWATIAGEHRNFGHVGVDTRGAGVGLMSTGRGEQWADGAALIDFRDWTSSMAGAVAYRGWARTNGDNAVDIGGGPSVSATAAAAAFLQEDEMILFGAPGVHPALGTLGAWSSVDDGEKLAVAKGSATRLIQYESKREFQVMRALCLHAQTPNATVTMTEEQLALVEAAAKAGGIEAVRDLDFVVAVG